MEMSRLIVVLAFSIVMIASASFCGCRDSVKSTLTLIHVHLIHHHTHQLRQLLHGDESVDGGVGFLERHDCKRLFLPVWGQQVSRACWQFSVCVQAQRPCFRVHRSQHLQLCNEQADNTQSASPDHVSAVKRPKTCVPHPVNEGRAALCVAMAALDQRLGGGEKLWCV